MSMVRVIAIEPCNEYKPGDDFLTTERQAGQMIARGLVKMATPVANKMAQPTANKANPSPAAGQAAASSASPAAPASPRPTVQRSGAGARRITSAPKPGDE